MKKVIEILTAFLAILFIFSNTVYALTGTFSSSKTTVKKGEEIVLTISFNEKIIAGNFEIIYNPKAFEFVEGINIECAEKEGKIACIYADISGQGTNEFKIRLKAKKSGKTSEFEINNVKMRTDSKDESYTESEITGINNKIKVKVKPNFIMIALIGILLIAGIVSAIKIFKKK